MTETGPSHHPVPPTGGTGSSLVTPSVPWLQRARLAWESMKASPPLSSPAVVAAGVLAVVAVLAVALTLWRSGTKAPPELVLPRAAPGAGAGPVPSTGAAGGSAGAVLASSTTVGGGLATVHAAGAVAHPGIYVVPAGGRVADVITAAGGPLAEADFDRLNLAARVSDGDRVYVPRRGEGVEPVASGPSGAGPGPRAASGGPKAPSPEAPLDLNTSDETQLDALPGVGPATAHAIVGYRQRNGRFRSVDELIDVPGIGPSKLETMRPLVRV